MKKVTALDFFYFVIAVVLYLVIGVNCVALCNICLRMVETPPTTSDAYSGHAVILFPIYVLMTAVSLLEVLLQRLGSVVCYAENCYKDLYERARPKPKAEETHDTQHPDR